MKIVYPPPDSIGVRVLNVELATVKLSEIARIKQLIYDYKLVILPKQNVNEVQYLQFASSLGIVQINLDKDSYLKSSDLSILQADTCNCDRFWYSDYSFLQEPFPFTMVRIENLPQATRAIYFIDMQQVYREIPERLKSYLADKKAFHEVKWCNKFFASKHTTDLLSCDRNPKVFSAAKHPLITVHPVRGVEILYLNSGFTTRIEGMNYQISQEILNNLFAFIARDKYIQPYILQEGDILLWSNRTLNYLNPRTEDLNKNFGYRISISDGLPFYYSSIKKAIERGRNQQLTLNF